MNALKTLFNFVVANAGTLALAAHLALTGADHFEVIGHVHQAGLFGADVVILLAELFDDWNIGREIRGLKAKVEAKKPRRKAGNRKARK